MSERPQPLPVLCSWSGGKDSAFALLQATRLGHRPVGLITMLDEDGQHSRAHGLSPEILHAQARALGLPLLLGRAGWGDYEAEFLRLAATGKRDLGAQGIVFGDIDLQAHREWEEQTCAKAGLQLLLPLWRQDRRKLVDQMIDAGLKMMITACQEPLPPALLGRDVSHELLDEIESLGACCCGEEGEYHTVLYDCPLFEHPLTLLTGPQLERHNYWQLTVQLAQI